MQEPTGKLKILSLHGYGQGTRVFRIKMAAFKKALKNVADIAIVDAPLTIEKIDGETGQKLRAWWFSNEINDDFDYKDDRMHEPPGFSRSISFLCNVNELMGPFDGVMGFSQGATMAALLCGLQRQNKINTKLKFAVIVSGFKSRLGSHSEIHSSIGDFKSLHIIGRKDACIPPEESESLAALFSDKKVIYHQGGHFVPSHKSVTEHVVKFLQQFV